MFKKREKLKTEAKVIDIEAGLEGNLKFNSPVNLRISGKFEGALEIKGNLTIGEMADVKAKIIKGDNITINGNVTGDIVSSNRLELSASARVIGNIKTPALVISEGALLEGKCEMPIEDGKSESKESPKKKK